MEGRSRYIPALDGVRGLAAVAVVLAHTMGWQGGAIGVDVFFVLSGFLITSLLAAELGRTGRLDFGRFYLRRARRLLPPLAPVIVAGTIVDLTVMPGRWGGPGGPVASLLYLQNIRLGVTDAMPDALGHTWSLSIEEHFYLLWPFLLLALWRWRGAGGALAAAVGAAAAVELDRLLLATVDHASPQRLYFLDDMRADGLLLGCAVAILLHMGRLPNVRRMAGALGAVVLVAVATLATLAGSYSVVVAAMVPLAATVVIAHLARSECRWLASPPLRYLGRVSYALYLWHDVFAACLAALGVPYGPLRLVLAGGLGLLLAAASDRLIEGPIRRRAGRRLTSRMPLPMAA